MWHTFQDSTGIFVPNIKMTYWYALQGFWVSKFRPLIPWLSKTIFHNRFFYNLLCEHRIKWSTFIGFFQSWFTNMINFIFVTSAMWFGAGCKRIEEDKVIIIKSIVWKNYLKWYVSQQWHNYHYRMTMLLRALLYIGW